MTTLTAKKTDALPISYDDVLTAAKRIKDGIYHTPAEYSEVVTISLTEG